jgi:hypothetical protein
VSDRRLIQVIRRPAPEILARVTVSGGTTIRAVRPGDADLGGAPGMTFR